eukprot:969904-Prorocentrum_minimum.AAC.1
MDRQDKQLQRALQRAEKRHDMLQRDNKQLEKRLAEVDDGKLSKAENKVRDQGSTRPLSPC